MDMMIRAVLFDADGVIILPNHFADYLEQELSVTPAVTHEFFGSQFRDCLLGRADLKETIKPFLPRWGWQGSVQAFLQRWFEIENAVDPRMLNVVITLRKRGIICGLATNQEHYRIEYMKKEMGFADTFNVIFSSAELGAMKHEPLYYKRVTHILALRPNEILFWDDARSNVEIARDYGWNAEHFSNFESFQQTLQGYLRQGVNELDN
jgi:putative hydrolase of the HAD superfamily